MPSDSGVQNDIASPLCTYRSDSGTVLASPRPSSPQPSPFNPRPPMVCQPSTANDLGWEQVEIPESPGATLMSPTARGLSRHHHNAAYTNEDSCGEEQQEHERETEEQNRTTSNREHDGLPPSKWPGAPIPAPTIQLPESGIIPRCQNLEIVQDGHQSQTQSAGGSASAVATAPSAEDGLCVRVQDIALLHIEGHRETDCGLEYLCVGKVWLRPEADILSRLLQSYQKQVSGKDRLATLRPRKRMRKDVDSAQATQHSASKKVKRASG